MKLYYAPAACSLAPHIVAEELALPVTLIKVDTASKRTEHGEDFLAINPKGYVPALQLDDGTLLTEGPVISQYLADLKPDAGLMPAVGSAARYQLQSHLGYINSELHKSFSPLFATTTHPETRAERAAYLQKRYTYIESILAKTPFLGGDRFSIADAYLFVVTNWAKFVKLDLSAFPSIEDFQQRVAARESVQRAMRKEKLIA